LEAKTDDDVETALKRSLKEMDTDFNGQGKTKWLIPL
jgi:hypothetical protein